MPTPPDSDAWYGWAIVAGGIAAAFYKGVANYFRSKNSTAPARLPAVNGSDDAMRADIKRIREILEEQHDKTVWREEVDAEVDRRIAKQRAIEAERREREDRENAQRAIERRERRAAIMRNKSRRPHDESS
ncbi:hypothetical protein BA190_09255 [Labrys sp. WJW]|uniref:hypothetical protein n=1 Tax=Labrys sp. WJW TaxID=1737983 RepID=UPI00082E2CB7|nr:hypothetical protein [Labrys sp. WJW]OCC05092.1 hypothetical protein BA190_09255 [Labrys sp. WJW]